MWLTGFLSTAPSVDEPHDPGLCPEPYASMFEDYEFPKSPNVWDTLEGKPQYQKIWAGKNRESDRDADRLAAIGIVIPHASFRQSVKIGRMNLRVAVAPHHILSGGICHKQNNLS